MFLNTYNLILINLNIFNIYFFEFFFSLINNLSFTIDFSDTFYLFIIIFLIIKQFLFYKDKLLLLFYKHKNLSFEKKFFYRSFYKSIFVINIYAFKTKII